MSNKALSLFLDYLQDSDDAHDGHHRPAELVTELKFALSQSIGESRSVIKVSDAEIAAYLDRRLGPEKLEAFEAKLLASPELREEVVSLAHLMEDLFVDLGPSMGLDDSEALSGDDVTIEGLHEAFEQKRPLTPIQHQELFRNPVFRAEYNRLIRSERMQSPPVDDAIDDPSIIVMPAQIAASSDKLLKDRSFPGGSIHIGSAGRPNLVQINIRIDRSSFVASHLELRGADGALAYLALPAPDSTGEITRVVDLQNESDGLAVELLRDPRTRGLFKAM